MRLEEILAELHNQLESAQTLDADQVAKLRCAVVEIEAAISDESALPAGAIASSTPPDDLLAAEQAHHDSLADRLRHAVRDFEDSHPSLTNAVGQVADMLAQMGI